VVVDLIFEFWGFFYHKGHKGTAQGIQRMAEGTPNPLKKGAITGQDIMF